MKRRTLLSIGVTRTSIVPEAMQAHFDASVGIAKEDNRLKSMAGSAPQSPSP